MDATGLSLSTTPPPWVPFPDLKAAFLWLAINRFRFTQKYVERRWLGVLADLQRSPWNWRLPLPQQLESLRRDDGNIFSWKYLDGPHWSDGTVQALTWEKFRRLLIDIGTAECYGVLHDWGLRPLRGDTLPSFRAAELQEAVFGKRLQLEARLNSLHDRLAPLGRERERERARRLAMRPPQPSRLIVEHGPAALTHQGTVGLKVGLETTERPEAQADLKVGSLRKLVVPRLWHDYHEGRYQAPGELKRHAMQTVIPEERAKLRKAHGISAKQPDPRTVERWVAQAKRSKLKP